MVPKVVGSIPIVRPKRLLLKTSLNYITKNISPALSLATIEAVDYTESETAHYSRAYYILSGTMHISIDGTELELSPEDACFIEKDTPYEMRGTFKAVVINQPAFGS